jgi:16S rRNA G966 N2-methylase RsmD
MAKKTVKKAGKQVKAASPAGVKVSGRRSAVVDTRVVFCGDNLDQLRRLPEGCVDLVYIDPPFNSNRNYEGSGERRRRNGRLKTGTHYRTVLGRSHFITSENRVFDTKNVLSGRL